jgi:hypothetical protein
MYVDGHEREDVVQYRNKFIARWKEYSKRFITSNRDGAVDSTPTTKWAHSSSTAVAERKGEGPSIMVSDFLTTEWGRLKDDDK